MLDTKALAVGAVAGAAALALYLHLPKRAELYHLLYFDARGVSETMRLCMAAKKIPFTETRYSIKIEGGKPQSSAEHKAAKEAGSFEPNLNRLPVLFVDGKPLGQSKAIERYICAKHKLLGSGEFEAALVDAFCEHVRDMKDAYQKVRAIADADEKKAGMDKYFGETLPDYLNKVEKVTSGNGHAVGSKLTLADICFYVFACEFFDNLAGVAAALEGCPKLQSIPPTVKADPNIAAYLAKRKATPF
mmetsp:Transcript_11117/g.36581  ORF Transcript_11117/g.36581 Transcript_11117/m.36581 type:complete len:246 (+) Transcript_11117:3-740(+)